MRTIDEAIEVVRADAEAYEETARIPLSLSDESEVEMFRIIWKKRAESLRQTVEWLKELKELRERQTPKWIPVTYHDLTDEERESYGDSVIYVFDCPLPEEGKEILISCKGRVRADVCAFDGEGYYLEGVEDWREVDAWMPLPEPYRNE